MAGIAIKRYLTGTTWETLYPASDYSTLINKPSTFTPTAHAHGNLTDAGAIGSTADLPIKTTTSGVLTAGSFGTTSGTFCQGNDSRLSDARTPLSHVHGSITNAGAIGSTADLPIKTTTSGVLAAGAWGTGASTFCQGNDSRLSDARTPTSHSHGNLTNTGTISSTAAVATGDYLTITQTGSNALTRGSALSFDTTNTTTYLRKDGTWATPSDADTNWYPTAFGWTAGTTAGPTGSLTGTGMSAVSFAAVPSAAIGASGVITTGAQTIAGAKTFRDSAAYDGIVIGGRAGGTGTYAVTLVPATLTASRTLTLPDATGTLGMEIHSHDSTYQPLNADLTDIAGLAASGLLKRVGAGDYTVITDNSANWTTAYGWGNHSGLYRPVAWVPSWTDVTSKPTTFAPIIGSGAADAVAGNDARLTDARTPTSHTHGSITNTGYLGVTANLPLITGTAGVIQAGSFGTAANTFCQGDDSRLSDARTPTSHSHGNIANGGTISATNAVATSDMIVIAQTGSGLLTRGTALSFDTTNTTSYLRKDGTFATPPAAAHTHGNITNTGYIGTTATLPIITGTAGILQAGSFGTGAGTFCQGNDSRLSDARTPTSHTHGNITNAGAIGSTSGLPIKTSTSGVLVAGAFGTTSSDFMIGNDVRVTGICEYLTSNVSRTSTSYSSTNLSIGLSANTFYKVEFIGLWITTLATTGLKLGIIFTGTGAIEGEIRGSITDGAVATELKASLYTISATSTTGNSITLSGGSTSVYQPCGITAFIRVVNAGTLTIQTASESTDEVILKADSAIVAYPISSATAV